MNRALYPVFLGLLLGACQKKEEPPPVDTDIAPEQEPNDFPLPEDIDEIDFVSAFQEAARLMLTVTTQQPWRGHASSMGTRQLGCPDFYTGQFTVGGLETVGQDYGVAWNDDCLLDSSLYYDGWLWWNFDVQESGDPTTLDGHVSDATRDMDGDAVVGDVDGVRFEFDGTAHDALARTEAYGYQHYTYSTIMNATVTGRDIFALDSVTPKGYRTDLSMYTMGGDIETFDAKGNVYLFEPQIMGRFDSIGVDMSLHGALGAAPTDCQLEPLGWIGIRDAEAYWYDVVFLPRDREDIVGNEYPNDPLSVCDGCGRLYVQGVEQEGKDVCVDFSFIFDEITLPDADEYVLPFHSL